MFEGYEVTRDQFEILLGLISPFQAWLDANDQWWVVPENGPPATAPTFVEAVIRVANSWRQDEGN